MEADIKISCIIPTCDRPKLLNEAINSILAQTYPFFEIIVVNNGKDKVELSDEALARVAVYDTEPYIGVSRARNFGAQRARGEYLAFLDDDDKWSPKYLELAISAIKQGAQCVFSRMDFIKDGRLELFKNPHGNLTLKNLLTYNPGVGGSNIVIAKKLFFKVRGFDPNLVTSEDKALTIELLKMGAKITTLPDNQVIINNDIPGLRNAQKMAEGIYRFTKKYKNLMTLKQYFYNWYKIFYYRYKSGKKLAIVPYIFLTLFFSLQNLLKGILKFLKK